MKRQPRSATTLKKWRGEESPSVLRRRGCQRPSRSPGRAITRNSRQRTKPFQVYQWLGGVKTIKPDSNPENRVRIDQCSH
ncbi:MAG: hypothetical protein IM504_10185 [Microcystis sp. M038S2]|uniref:hypothetical protein n=1 Tax=unclassified Microcystis TaxID=2643300 RepID=UPI00258E007A|nr:MULTISPECIES: hypothetical protein [unclassified Microcystis]MCA2682576.1 hypothetical protein [Microcystis sp. M046S2]MCA2705217.1 hypothetical protein [Microcystis sp. M038S2]MCA2948801.1 hypothetical protein [Microcystis sp. M109S1]MCA2951777.1 hypothetical protein [Microcystis sp. M112S1]